MQMYVNYFDRHVITEAENHTIGIVHCKKKSSLVEITLPKDVENEWLRECLRSPEQQSKES
jgi:hypothetical protein